MNPSAPPGIKSAELSTFWLLLAVAIVLASGLGLRSPWPADEPRFAQIAREMVESGQWLFPMRGGEPYPDKPPVFIWLVALLYQVTGQLKVAFLLPSALAGLGTLWLVNDIGRRLWGADVARNALLVMVFTPQFLLQAKTAQIDALVCFWITLGCYGLLRHFMTGPAWGWYLTAFVAMALGIMTKGVGFLPALMLIPLALWGAAARDGGSTDRVWSARNWLGLVALLGTLALWLGPMLWQVAISGSEDLRAYRDNILMQQTATRYASPWMHIKPWHYFLTQAIPTVWFPLVLLLLTQLPRLGQTLRADPRARVLFFWVVLVLVFFSLSPGKREVYILPALPMLALVTAVVWKQAIAEAGDRWSAAVLRWALLLASAAVLVLGGTAWWHPEWLNAQSGAGEYADDLATLARPILAAGTVMLTAAALTRRRQILEQLAIASLSVWLVVAWWVWPVMDTHRTPKDLMLQVEERLPPDQELGLISSREQILLFARRPLVQFGYVAPIPEQERNAWRWMQEDPSRILLLPDTLNLACFDLEQAETLGFSHRRTWILLRASSMQPGCPSPERVRRYRWAPQRTDILQ